MIIFTPNTVIKSADVNMNFNDLNNLMNVPYAEATINVDNSANDRTFAGVISDTISFNGTTTFTVQVKGIYYIQAQQLMSTGAPAVYFCINVGGVNKRYAYINGATAVHDASVSWLGEIEIGIGVKISIINAPASTWTNEHAGFRMFLVRRT